MCTVFVNISLFVMHICMQWYNVRMCMLVTNVEINKEFAPYFAPSHNTTWIHNRTHTHHVFRRTYIHVQCRGREGGREGPLTIATSLCPPIKARVRFCGFKSSIKFDKQF